MGLRTTPHSPGDPASPGATATSTPAPATAATAATPATKWTKVALRWLPTLFGYPAGGLAAKLIVGPVDAVGPALLGGAITGAAIGLAQWFGMRRNRPAPELWVLATSAGMALGLTAATSLVDYEFTTSALALQGAVCGVVVGAAQAAVLWRRLGALAVAWPVYLSGAWALGWTITASAGIDVDARYTVFGSSGALVVTALTVVLPLALDRRAS